MEHDRDWRFYNGRDHPTVIQAFSGPKLFGKSDPDPDALVSELKDRLTRRHDADDEKKVGETPDRLSNLSCIEIDELADAIADRVWARMINRMQQSEPE